MGGGGGGGGGENLEALSCNVSSRAGGRVHVHKAASTPFRTGFESMQFVALYRGVRTNYIAEFSHMRHVPKVCN